MFFGFFAKDKEETPEEACQESKLDQCAAESPAEEEEYLHNPDENPLAALSQVPTFERLDTFCSPFVSGIRKLEFSIDGPPLGKLPAKWGHQRPFERLLFISAVRSDALGIEIDYFMLDLVVEQCPTEQNPDVYLQDSSA